MNVHPIEARSYAILRARVDTTALAPWTRAVMERVIHASADPAYLDDLVVSGEADLQAAADALAAGAPVVADAEMVAAGITGVPVRCRVREAQARAGLTRSAVGLAEAAAAAGPGAVYAIGNAPTALAHLLTLDAAPTLVVGLPVGFVGAVEAKAALRASGLPFVTNRSEKGGSAVAAAAVNALRYGLTR